MTTAMTLPDRSHLARVVATLVALVLPEGLPAGPLPAQESTAPASALPAPQRGLESISHDRVTLRGGFWGPRLETHHGTTIRHALDALERNGHITNFDRAAGKDDGELRGHHAFDSDLYKALEGAMYSLQHFDDPGLRKRVESILDRILAAQQDDGYLISYFIVKGLERRWTDLRLEHQMYNAGHFFEMAVEHHQLSDDSRVLDAARRFADHIDGIFGPGKRHDVGGHEEIELALVKLYRATGERRYLELCRFLLDERGCQHNVPGHQRFDPATPVAVPEGEEAAARRAAWLRRLRTRNGRMQDHKPLVEQGEAIGHAVRAGYVYSAMADIARFSDAPEYRRAVGRIWRDVVGRKMYVNGGIGTAQYRDEGFGDPYLLPNQTYCESCASIAHVFWQHRMNLLEGEAKYADVMELALYNAALSGMSLRGDSFFYQNPLESRRGAERRPWIGLACCPTNLTRFTPQVGGFVYARAKDRIYVNLFAAGEATVEGDDGRKVTIRQETDYPWDGRVELTVTPATEKATFELCVRIPCWAQGRPAPGDLYRYASPAPGRVTLAVNGRPVEAKPADDGYVHLGRAWKAGDRVELDMPMPVRRVYAHEKVLDDRGKVSLLRGPVVYCLEQVDHPGIDLFGVTLPRSSALRAEHRPDLLGGVTVLTGKGRDGQGVEVDLVAVPYHAWANREKGAMTTWIREPEEVKTSSRAGDRLTPAAFADPPVPARPGCYWAWLNGSVTAERITRDLEAMERGGMRGGEIWDVAAHADPDRRVPAGPAFLGPESTRLIVHAIREASRLGLEIGMVASSGWNAGGAWIPPEHAGKGLYHSATRATGPGEFHGKLPVPELPKLCPRDPTGRPVYLREVAVLAVPHSASKMIAALDRVVDLSGRLGADGTLRWEIPEGDWSILRFVCSNHGQQLIVPSPNSGGPMIDFLDPRATEFHLGHIVHTILRELGRATFEGTSFKTLEFDSMELGGFTPWNPTMAGEFRRRLGYSVLPYLPLLAGWELADREVQDRFLYDWRKLVSDRLIESHYVTGRKLLARYGVKLVAEAGGPGPPIWNSNPVEGIRALGAVDIPRGEFWIRHRGIFLIKEIASAAHVYDKRLVDAEAFTTWRRWVDGPLQHKKVADRALCEGLNSFSLHTFASSPPDAGRPGWAYHAGTDINPTATWWPMVRGLTDYLARCSLLLRQGWFVADVCYYYGDRAPNFYPPLCNVPEKPRLSGLQPGHDYDVCSTQVILERMRVEGGRIVLPDGMSYAALVLPEQDSIPATVLEKVRRLVAGGATVIAHRRPTRAPGLGNPETGSRAVRRRADELWGPAESPTDSRPPDREAVSIRPLGKGRFIVASDRSRALREIGLPVDFEARGRADGTLGPLDFIHRRTTDDELYFLRNKTGDAQSLTCRFRVAAESRGQEPELWWPHSGHRSACHGWKSAGSGYTELPVELGPWGSVFVVFRKKDPSRGATDAPLAPEPSLADDAPPRVTLDGPWQVAFPAGWGAPRETTFTRLRSWTESEEEGIRYFSGIATYRKSFTLPETPAGAERLFLELGDLAEIAEVTLNGRTLGLVWLPPYRIEVTGAVRAGTNRLEIRVANLWANRLNGDSLLPESRRFTRSNLDRMQTDPTSDSSYGQIPRGKERPVYTETPPLMRSGLFGPVRITARTPTAIDDRAGFLKPRVPGIARRPAAAMDEAGRSDGFRGAGILEQPLRASPGRID